MKLDIELHKKRVKLHTCLTSFLILDVECDLVLSLNMMSELLFCIALHLAWEALE